MSMIDSRLKPRTTSSSATCPARRDRGGASGARRRRPRRRVVGRDVGRTGRYSRASSPHTAPVCRIAVADETEHRAECEVCRDLHPRGGLRCVVFTAPLTARGLPTSRRLQRDTARPLAAWRWWRCQCVLGGTAVLLSGCSWSEVLGLGWPEGHHPRGAPEPGAVDRLADRRARRRRDRVGPDLLDARRFTGTRRATRSCRASSATTCRWSWCSRSMPFLIISVLFYFTVVVQEKMLHKEPNPEVVIDVTAFQWNWKFGYQKVDFTDGTFNYDGADPRARPPWRPSPRASTSTARRWSARFAGSNPEDRTLPELRQGRDARHQPPRSRCWCCPPASASSSRSPPPT